MPNLPTLNVPTQTLFDRLVAAFGDSAGYKAWLKAAVRDELVRREAQAKYDDVAAEVAADQQQTDQDFQGVG